MSISYSQSRARRRRRNAAAAATNIVSSKTKCIVGGRKFVIEKWLSELYVVECSIRSYKTCKPIGYR